MQGCAFIGEYKGVHIYICDVNDYMCVPGSRNVCGL